MRAPAEPVRITDAQGESDFTTARRLFEEYAQGLAVDLCFQGFDAELRALDAMYGPPTGGLILAWRRERAVGCAGVRKLSATECEMKRLYVRDEVRGGGYGRLLAREIIVRARKLGYERMKLDTLESMTAARGLYVSLGFRQCAAYYGNPLPGVTYMELDLTDCDTRPPAAGAS